MGADNVLVIEDLRTFRFPATYARTIFEAEYLITSQDWTEIWWDFDMGLTRDADNTYKLALALEIKAIEGIFLPVQRMVVHSANPHGGDRLMAALSPWYKTVRVAARDYLAPGSEEMEWIGP